MPVLHVHLLGDFRLVYDGAPVTQFFQGRLQALLAYLLLHRRAPQARQRLAFLFWPDSVEPQARNNLRQLLHYMRNSLPNADHYLHVETKTVQWRADASYTLDVIDLERDLEEAARAAEEGYSSTERTALESAVRRYRGELLPGCYDDWILLERERLHKLFLAALERLISLAEAERDYVAAIEHGERYLRHDPLHEATYRRLMRLHALQGNRARALRVYHTCVTLLQRELGLDPGAETVRAYRRLLNLQETLPMPGQPRAMLSAPATLVGRQDAWQALLRAWRQTSAVGAYLVLISGEAGIGKTRLAEEFLAWAAQQGIITARTQAYALRDRPAFGPLLHLLHNEPLSTHIKKLSPIWIAELARLMPELEPRLDDFERYVPIPGSSQRLRVYQALARAVLGKADAEVLLIDDLQWCDTDTLSWLHYILHLDLGVRLLLLGTVRNEDVDQTNHLASLLPELRRHDLAGEIVLAPLDAVDTAALAEDLLGREMGIEEVARLYRYTEGNPLFIVETIRAQVRPGARFTAFLSADRRLPVPASSEIALPRKVHALIQARLRALSPSALELAGLAATVGRFFTTNVLAHAAESGEEALVRAIDELGRRHIVREQGSNAYDFSHGRIREVAYAQLSAARRRLYHRRVAAALEQVYVENLDAYYGEIAAHHEKGDSQALAAAYYVRAAMVAQRTGNEDEVANFLRRALSCLPALPDAEGDG